MPLPDLQQAKLELDERGVVVLPGFIDPTWLAELQRATESLFDLEGAEAGSEFKTETGSRRLANLVNKGETFQRVVAEPRLLGFIELVLGDEFKLSSLNARSANPHNEISQPLHADMGAIAPRRMVRFGSYRVRTAGSSCRRMRWKLQLTRTQTKKSSPVRRAPL